ncbi:MAG: preprotein translocase subunit YajC [Gammaproteobacteria bacterium]|nr:MAG: preprotein translocase subunit YajC [Gammaproteobacteria bacterium]
MMISVAYAQTAGAPQGGGMSSLIMMVAIFAVIYFVMLRPQQKKQKELKALIEALKKGDEVLTVSGILGRIKALDEQYIELEVAGNIVLKMQRNSVVSVLPKGSVKAIK